jgi:hypothetical protein
LSLLSAGPTRSFADVIGSLSQTKSFHVVEKSRYGIWPNWIPTNNALSVAEYWFQQDPNATQERRSRAAFPAVDVWRQGNRVLMVNHETGERSLRLDNSPFDFDGIHFDPAILSDIGKSAKFREVASSRVQGVVPQDASAFWFGESQDREHKMICYAWLSRTNDTLVRLQYVSTAFPHNGAEVLVREFEFSDFNADFPLQLSFEISDADLTQLGISRTELDNLTTNAMSFRLSGEPGADVIGTITDQSGSREIRGKLPFSVVHELHDKVTFDFRMADGFRHNFEVGFGLYSHLSAHTHRIVGWASTNWAGRLEAKD